MLLKQKPKETENKMLNSDYVWTKTRAGFLTKDVDSNNKEKKLSKEKHSIQSFYLLKITLGLIDCKVTSELHPITSDNNFAPKRS